MLDIICYTAGCPKRVPFNKHPTMKLVLVLSTLWMASAALPLQGQAVPFTIHLERIDIAGLPGVQSYAHARQGTEWLILGGRTDGLHRRQPWATFDEAGNNRDILVIDPEAGTFWHASLDPLPLHIQDQLSSTNMEFHQAGDRLYVIGGYGYSRTVQSKLTYAMLTAIDVPGLIAAVKGGEDIVPYFRSITDTEFAVTGGHLKRIGDVYYIAGGQKFEGNYNPMNHGTFIQTYTDAIRRFQVQDDGQALSVTHLPAWSDTTFLHRRDYNVVDQILPDGQVGFTLFAGVFRRDVDLPYLDVVNATPEGPAPVDGFAQYFNHYHCATVPVHDAERNEMHSLFFGGIAQYYEDQGMLVQDDNVPFVRTIARVTRTADGQMTEYKLPVEMPGYFGASAEFILHPNAPADENGILRLHEIGEEATPIGYIYGGIESPQPNIFWINTGTESVATPAIFRVVLTREGTTAVDHLNPHSLNGLQLQVYPNPTGGAISVRFHTDRPGPTRLLITDSGGKQLLSEDITREIVPGDNLIHRTCEKLSPGTICLVSLIYPGGQATQRIIVNE